MTSKQVFKPIFVVGVFIFGASIGLIAGFLTERHVPGSVMGLIVGGLVASSGLYLVISRLKRGKWPNE